MDIQNGPGESLRWNARRYNSAHFLPATAGKWWQLLPRVAFAHGGSRNRWAK